MIAQLDTKTVYSFMESGFDWKILQMAKIDYSHLIMDVDNLYGAYHF